MNPVHALAYHIFTSKWLKEKMEAKAPQQESVSKSSPRKFARRPEPLTGKLTGRPQSTQEKTAPPQHQGSVKR